MDVMWNVNVSTRLVSPFPTPQPTPVIPVGGEVTSERDFSPLWRESLCYHNPFFAPS